MDALLQTGRRGAILLSRPPPDAGGARRLPRRGPAPADSASQGFHPGQFTDAEILYVYDCGSEPKRQVYREIDNLLACRPERQLDVLVLSHFDRDHICGTPRLLRATDGFSVDTIILPFVDMDERVVALARAAASTETFGGQIDTFFVDMVFEPTATLAAFGPRRIIFVRGDGGDGERGLGTAPDPGGDFDPKAGRDRDGSVRVDLKPAHPDDPQRPLELTTLGFTNGVEVLEVRHAAAVIHDPTWSLLWKLVPWVCPAAPAAVATFKAGVETLFEWKKGTFLADHHQARSPREQGSWRLAFVALDLDLPVPANPNQLLETSLIILVALFHPRRQYRVGMPRIDADNRNAYPLASTAALEAPAAVL